MDEGGYMPFEPITLVSGFASALWSDEPIVLTEYKESPIVQKKDVLGLWSIDADDLILLFTEENTYIASDGELYPQYDSIIKDGTWDIDGETAYISSNGEKVAISTLYETKIMTKWDPDELPITGVFIIKNGDKEIAMQFDILTLYNSRFNEWYNNS